MRSASCADNAATCKSSMTTSCLLRRRIFRAHACLRGDAPAAGIAARHLENPARTREKGGRQAAAWNTSKKPFQAATGAGPHRESCFVADSLSAQRPSVLRRRALDRVADSTSASTRVKGVLATY